MQKPPLDQYNRATIQALLDDDKRFHVLPKGISPKVNVIERLEVEFVFNDIADQYIINNKTGTHPC